MYLFACVSVGAGGLYIRDLYIRDQRSIYKKGLPFLVSLYTTFWDKNSHWTQNLLIQLDWLAKKSQGPSLLCLLCTGFMGISCYCHAWLLCLCECSSLCLYGKYLMTELSPLLKLFPDFKIKSNNWNSWSSLK